ncbi:hypothetical protein AgCh_021721 [Apium graveolens]
MNRTKLPIRERIGSIPQFPIGVEVTVAERERESRERDGRVGIDIQMDRGEHEPTHLTFPVAETSVIGNHAELETGGHSPLHANPGFLHGGHVVMDSNNRVGVSCHRLHALLFLPFLRLYSLILNLSPHAVTTASPEYCCRKIDEK